MNSSTKHSVIASVVSSEQTMPTPFNSRGSSKSNSSLGIIYLFQSASAPAPAELPFEVFLHCVVLGIGGHAVCARFPWSSAAAPAELPFEVFLHCVVLGIGGHAVC